MQKINKISKKGLVIISILIGINYYSSNAQISCGTLGNLNCGLTDYLGWASTVGKTLDIKNESNNPINFLTNTGAGGTTPIRMTITGAGNVGIGTTTPNNLLQINGGQYQVTNSSTGSASTDGLLIGQNSSIVEINQQENAAIKIFTDATQRMYIDAAGTGSGSGYVGIGNNFSSPASRLHINQGSDSSCFFQMTGNNTGTLKSDGFRIGVINKSGSPYNVELRQQENADMLFFTNNNEQARITAAGNLGIGLTTPAAKVDAILTGSAGVVNTVYQGTLNCTGTYATNFNTFLSTSSSGDNCNNYGIVTQCYITGNNTISMGGAFSAAGGNNSYGVWADATTSVSNYGVHASASGASSDAMGVFAEAYGDFTSSNDVHGVHTEAIDNGGTYNSIYGIYAKGPSSCSVSAGNVLTCPRAAGYFDGDVGIVGSVYQTSDMNLKDSILPLLNASLLLKRISPKTFKFRTQDFPSMRLSMGPQYGLIAQDIDTILPTMVKNSREPAVRDSLGNILIPQVDYKAINYIEFIPIIIAAFKEQQNTIDSLRNLLNGQLKKSNPNQLFIQNQNKISVELASENSIILDQNDPNPFSDQTTIHYFIPENVGSAKIMFYDSNGHVLRTVDILQKGDGSLIVYASQLKNGIYQYTLIADGKSIETKRMVKQ